MQQPRKLVDRHLRSLAGLVGGEKPEAGYRDAVEMVVRVAKNFVAAYGEMGRSMRSSSLNGVFVLAPYTEDDDANTSCSTS